VATWTTGGGGDNLSTNTAVYTSAANTTVPAVGDYIVVLVVASDSLDAAVVTDDLGGTYTRVRQTTFNGGVDQVAIYIRDAAVTTTNPLKTSVDFTGDNATGCTWRDFRLAGATGAAVKSGANTGGAGTTPSVALGSAVATANPVIGAVGNKTNPAGITQPSGWTEASDLGYNTPTTGREFADRDSGETGSTITWGSTSATAWGAVVVEFEAASNDRRAVVTFAEMEVPTAPRRALVTFAEMEVPNAPRRAIVTFAELEVPDVPTDRRAIITFAELEVPTAPRRALVTFAEMEVPTAPRRALITFAELEVPGAPRRAIVTFAEFEVPEFGAPVVVVGGGNGKVTNTLQYERWRKKAKRAAAAAESTEEAAEEIEYILAEAPAPPGHDNQYRMRLIAALVQLLD
jgi:enamine deaminase RidA (YjgF/YER057c/UK114 family)